MPPPPPPPRWSSCEEHELKGDFNNNRYFTLGDAVFVAQMWANTVPRTNCMRDARCTLPDLDECNGADFNGVNGFTLGDAIFVANVWAGGVKFPWQ